MDKKKDLALVKIEDVPNSLKVIRLGHFNDVKIGSTAHAIGHPKGLTWSFNTDPISQVRPNHKWEIENHRYVATVIQHQIPISEGNSGGPLIDNFGRLIGVNTFHFIEGQNLNFAIAINDVKEFLEAKHVVEDKKKPKKNPTWITKKCKEKKSYISKKCKDKPEGKSDSSGLKKTLILFLESLYLICKARKLYGKDIR